MSASPPASRVVGVVPWFPWPFSAWRWLTQPVAAERLAALRIGVAIFVLLDIALTYGPDVLLVFGSDRLADREIFGYRAWAPRLNWSLLWGFGNRAFSFIAFAGWALGGLWLAADLGTRALHPDRGSPERKSLGYSLGFWIAFGTLFVLGIWSRLADHDGELAYAWVATLVMVVPAALLLSLEITRAARSGADSYERFGLWMLGAAFGWTLALLAVAATFYSLERFEPESFWARLLGPWQDDAVLLAGAMIAWAASTFLLLVGLWTKPASILSFALFMSFANINTSLDNAGDTIRGILLFLLMLSPCGAVWSVDRLWRRARGDDAAILLVSPWPICVLLLQMAFIYFCNGVYKLHGESWRDGDSLYYVMHNIALVRFSPAILPMPLWLTQLLTYSVLIWEVGFPLLMFNRWTRIAALLFGVGFHLGIYFSMELGFFVPYALCMYLPFVPWERLVRRLGPSPVRSQVRAPA